MHTLSSIQQKINKELQKHLFSPSPPDLYVPIHYTLSLGGKRIRPLLLLLGYELFQEEIEKAIPQAIAIELFHNFTLLHDDIMDNSALRRNQPTVHKKWNNNTAILSGDVMLIIAYQYLSKCETEKLNPILETFNYAAIQVCEGQQWDMFYEQQISISIEEYIQMITQKTASLLAASLKIGAILGNANKQDINNMYEFGINIGIAFQLQDDLLDAFGNQEKFGKKIGGDIITNKKTFLLSKALEIADKKTKDEILQIISLKTFENHWKIEKMKNIYRQLSIQDITDKTIEHYFSVGLDFLNKISVNKKKKENIYTFINGLLLREV